MSTGQDQKKAKSKRSTFVIMVGDEGGILLQLQNKQVIKRIFAPSPEPEHVRTINDLLEKHPKSPVTMLVDMMDQSYVRQTLPPVSSFNVGKIIRRRLNKDFAADDIKGYLIFGREKNGRKDWNYLMASLACPTVLQKWIGFLVERPNPFKGIGLIPLECQPLIKALETTQLAALGKAAKPNEWHILISHHKVGGFRQVVIRGGQLVFTRLAQMVGEPTPEVIAGNIEQEMLNTFEYLKRLGLQDPAALTATIIASGEIKTAFDPKTIRAGQCHFYTPHEAATILAMEQVAKPEDHFGDIVIASYIGRRKKLLLKLYTPYTLRIAKLMRYISAARYAAATAALGILAWAAVVGSDIIDVQGSNADLDITQNSLNAQLTTETEKKKSLPQKVAFYIDVATLFTRLYQPVNDPLIFTHDISKGIEDLALVKSYRWSLSNAFVAAKDSDKKQISADIETVLLTPTEPRKEFVASANRLVEKMGSAFAEYEVTHSDIPGVLADNKELKTVISDTGSSSSSSEAVNPVLKFSIKWPKAGEEGHGPANKPVMFKKR